MILKLLGSRSVIITLVMNIITVVMNIVTIVMNIITIVMSNITSVMSIVTWPGIDRIFNRLLGPGPSGQGPWVFPKA